MYGEFPEPVAEGFEPGTAWEGLRRACARWTARGVRVVVIANPLSGPGTDIDGQIVSAWTCAVYQKAVRALQAAGATVLGYVPTGWLGLGGNGVNTHFGPDGRPTCRATRRRAITRAARAFVGAWYEHYPTVDGIFFDEVAVDGGLYAWSYGRLRAAVRRWASGARIGWNFGVPVRRKLRPRPGELYCQLENVERALWQSPVELAGAAQNVILLHHARRPVAPTFGQVVDAVLERGVGWFYTQPQTDWGHAPPADHFEALLEALADRGALQLGPVA